MKDLTFEHLKQANRNRCDGFFGPIEDWTPTDWATAMAGECGEACNFIKKMRRITSVPEIMFDGKDAMDYIEFTDKAVEEIADMIIYADLLCTRLGKNLGDEIQKKFNKVSEKVGAEIRI